MFVEGQRRARLLLDLIWYAALGGLVLAGMWFLLPRLAPFLLGLGTAVVLHPAAGWLGRRLGLSGRVAAVVAALLVAIAAAGLLCCLGLVAWVQCSRLLGQLPQLWQNQVLPFLRQLGSMALALAGRLLPGSSSLLAPLEQWAAQALGEWGTRLSAAAVAALAARLRRLPLFLLSLLFALMTTLMVSWDYPRVTGFLARQLPPRGVRLLHRVKAILAGSVLRLVRAYGIIFAITLAELCLGLWLLGVKEFFVLALLIALFDLLPAVGSGLVLCSWSAVVLAGGNLPLGLGLLVLWAVVAVVRSLVEPKIVGDQIGLHPLVTLTAMYFGLRTAGVLGMVGLPLLCMVVVRLQADGSLHLYR